MNDRRIFVFRVDYGNNYDFVQAELEQGRLRQGWGFGSLLDPVGEPDRDEYVRKFSDAWPEADEDPSKRFDILSPMLDMKQGDLVVIPRMPDPWAGTFTIAEIAGPYRFELAQGMGDFGHVITIDAATKLQIGYRDSLEARTASHGFRSYQKAVNNVWNERIREAVLKLWEGKSVMAPAEGWTRDIQNRLLQHVKEQVSKISPQDVEQLVQQTFAHAGYKFERRHRYDGSGGDADLIFSHPLPLLSEVDGQDLKVFVQVKRKDGTDRNDKEGLEQLERITQGEPYVMKVLFSTADDFTDETRELAQDLETVLICGDEAMAFLARGLTASPEGRPDAARDRELTTTE